MEEELLADIGLSMVINEPTHQEVHNGKQCRARCIDHIYTNASMKCDVPVVEAVGDSDHMGVTVTK